MVFINIFVFKVNSQTGEQITYGEMKKMAETVALNLLALGLKPRDILTIYSNNNLEYCIIKLAAWRIGAAVALLNAMAMASTQIIYHFPYYHQGLS